MSQQIITRTVSSIVDQRVELSNGQICREFEYLDAWNVLRIGMQVSIPSTGAAITGTPQLVFGLLVGAVNGYSNPTADTHFLGMRTVATSLTYFNDPPVTYSAGGSGVKVCKKVGITLTDGSAFSANGPFIANAVGLRRVGIFLQITKGSPNFTVEALWPNSAGGGEVDLDDATFLAMMEASTMAGAAGMMANYAASTGLTLAIDEATDGAFTGVCVAWDRTSPPVEVSNVRHRKLS